MDLKTLLWEEVRGLFQTAEVAYAPLQSEGPVSFSVKH